MRKLWVFLLLCVAAAGQPLAGVVRGAGIPLPGATVTATQGATTDTITTVADGSFTFADLAPGVWTVRAAMTGFTPAEQQVTIPPTGPAMLLELSIAPYQGPAAVATPAPAPPAGKKAPPSERAPAGASAAAPATPSIVASDNAFAVNGSVDNGAASPFGMSPAFGNARPRLGSMYNGGIGLIWGSSALDARSFSLTGQNTPKPNYNNLTGLLQFGGPLVIPHLLNLNQAPFVFVAYEKAANLNAVNTSALVPTVAERGGDLSALGAPNVAPGAISAQAAALLNLYPLPNLPAGGPYNYQAAVLTHQHQDRLQTRVVKSLSTRDQFAAVLSLSSTRSDNGSLFGFVDNNSQLGSNVNLSLRHRFTNRFYTTFATTYSRLATEATPFFASRVNVAGMAGIAGGDAASAYWGPPTLTFSDGFAPLRDGLPLHNRNQTMGFSGTAYWNYVDHNLTFGGDYNRLQFNYLAQTDPRGSFTFNGNASGNAFADFLLGTPDAAGV
ncbi:MAG: carboxypeptidase regulatory-like domain-containing protein, partial [Terriglobales bacterium]